MSDLDKKLSTHRRAHHLQHLRGRVPYVLAFKARAVCLYKVTLAQQDDSLLDRRDASRDHGPARPQVRREHDVVGYHLSGQPEVRMFLPDAPQHYQALLLKKPKCTLGSCTSVLLRQR